MTDPIDKLLDASRGHLHYFMESGAEEGCNLCESPIEKLFVKAMALNSLIIHGLIPCFVAEKWRRQGFLMEPQKNILDYRVDFLISWPDTKTSLVVECDGHDFHERTKDQAARDRSRDRVLSAKGYRVIRFTGSEIWNNPWQCSVDVHAQFLSIIEMEAAKKE